MTSPARPLTTTRNQRISAIAISIGASGLGALSFTPMPLAPLSLLALGVSGFGIWALCDEMGTEKPLIRAAFIAFIFAVFARSSALLNIQSADIARFYIFYAFAMLIALFLWSLAFLHRQPLLKAVGALGATATLLPIVLLVLAHMAVGIGGLFGLSSLFSLTDAPLNTTPNAIHVIDILFALWGVAASWLLWTGRLTAANLTRSNLAG